MNTNRSSLFDAVRSGAEDESEVVRVLDAYLSRVEAGQPADPEKLLAEHPALAGPLRACLKVMNLAGQLAEDSSAQPDVSFIDPSTDGSAMPSGLLSTLDFGHGSPPQIHLHELLDEREPLVNPRSAEMPDHGGSELGRYQLQGEIARGGMGVILKGHDIDLGRDVAIKVLARVAPGRSRGRAALRRGGADRRPVAAPGHRAGLRAGHASPTGGPTSR